MKNRTILAIIGILVGLWSQHLATAIDWSTRRGRIDEADSNKKNLKSMPYRSNALSFFREQENEIKVAEQRNDALRIGSKVLLSTYSAMMLRGGMALQSLFCSMASIKLIHQSKFGYDSEYRNLAWTVVTWISLSFSGSAAICNWAIDKFDQNLSLSDGNCIPATISSVFRIFARSTEIVGGTFVVFLLYLAL